VAQLEVSARAGYKTFLDGWQTASSMLQGQGLFDDIINPTCTCKRSCDNGQIVMPAVVADDEVTYPYSTNHGPGAPSPFSPREKNLTAQREVPANRMPSSHIASATNFAPSITPDSNDTTVAKVTAQSTDRMAATQQWQHADSKAVAKAQELPDPPVAHMGNFGYYAEYEPILRPPTSICSTNVSTAVRAAPWSKWTSAGKSQAASQTGSSLISKGGVGTSQAATALRNLQPSEIRELSSLPAQPVQVAAEPLPEQASLKPFDEIAAHDREEAQANVQWDSYPIETPSLAGSQAVPTTMPAMPKSDSDGTFIATLTPVQEVPQAQVESLKPMGTKSKPKAELASVLSQSTALKSSAAMALSNAQPAKRSTSKTGRTDASAGDRKSALSVSAPMTSGAAMALSGLTGPSSKRRGGSAERGSTESVIGAAPATKAMVATKAQATKENVDDGNVLPEAATVVASTAKPAKPSARHGGSRSRGPDAKSVISGLNSSSSASALLGPMLQGQPKRRSARPEGADVASVV